ncbi:MAG TPA: hypothetical protein VFQ80_09840 [Thermomicrobiales bacterium]|nr:hypothetical protein [Thermomicrobiales bacterium]
MAAVTDDNTRRRRVGETRDERRSRLVLARVVLAAERVGQERVARLGAAAPSCVVDGKTCGLETLLAVSGRPRRLTLTVMARGHG